MSGSTRTSDVVAWVNQLYAEGVDRKDAAAFADAFVPDGWMRFGNNPTIVGRDGIREAIAQFFTLFASLSHTSGPITHKDDTLVVEATVTYTLFTGGTVSVPACTIFRLAEGQTIQASECRIYVDLAPLFGALQGS